MISALDAAHIAAETILIQLFAGPAVPKTAGIGRNLVGENDCAVGGLSLIHISFYCIRLKIFHANRLCMRAASEMFYQYIIFFAGFPLQNNPQSGLAFGRPPAILYLYVSGSNI